MSSLVASKLVVLGVLPTPLLIMAVIVMATMLTEVMSCIAVCTILLPILADLSIRLQINPLLTMLPATLACSYAFMLPVATAQNAIVYSKGYLSVSEMAKCGVGMNVISFIVTTLAVYTYMDWYLGLTSLPDWTTAVGVTNLSPYHHSVGTFMNTTSV